MVAWTPYSYCFDNSISLIDPDRRAPENIIIGTTDGHSIDKPGHVAAAIEQYDESGNKTEIVFETSLLVRIRGQIKEENEGAGMLQKYQALYEKHQAPI